MGSAAVSARGRDGGASRPRPPGRLRSRSGGRAGPRALVEDQIRPACGDPRDHRGLPLIRHPAEAWRCAGGGPPNRLRPSAGRGSPGPSPRCTSRRAAYRRSAGGSGRRHLAARRDDEIVDLEEGGQREGRLPRVPAAAVGLGALEAQRRQLIEDHRVRRPVRQDRVLAVEPRGLLPAFQQGADLVSLDARSVHPTLPALRPRPSAAPPSFRGSGSRP